MGATVSCHRCGAELNRFTSGDPSMECLRYNRVCGYCDPQVVVTPAEMICRLLKGGDVGRFRDFMIHERRWADVMAQLQTAVQHKTPNKALQEQRQFYKDLLYEP